MRTPRAATQRLQSRPPSHLLSRWSGSSWPGFPLPDGSSSGTIARRPHHEHRPYALAVARVCVEVFDSRRHACFLVSASGPGILPVHAECHLGCAFVKEEEVAEHADSARPNAAVHPIRLSYID